jgi:hypothetical protein
MLAKFLHENDDDWSDVPAIVLGKTTSIVEIVSRVGVSDAQGPILRIDVDAGAGDSCFHECACSNGLVAIGYGTSLFIVRPLTASSEKISCDSYFGHLYSPKDFGGEIQPFAFLATSATELICISQSGAVSWVARDMAVDGIVVTQVDLESISGNAEWDPPGGWKPFKLRKETGEAIV